MCRSKYQGLFPLAPFPASSNSTIKISLFIAALAFQFVVTSPSLSAEIQNVRIGIHPDKTRIVLDVDSDMPFVVTSDNTGHSLVVELPNAATHASRSKTVNRGVVQSYEFQGKGSNQFLVVNASSPVEVKQAFSLAPSTSGGHRIVIDLIKSNEPETTEVELSLGDAGNGFNATTPTRSRSTSFQAMTIPAPSASATPTQNSQSQLSVSDWLAMERNYNGGNPPQPATPTAQTNQPSTTQKPLPDFVAGGAAPRTRGMELTFDVSHYAYEETVADAFYMSDTSAPFFYSVGLRNWGQPAEDGRFGFSYTGELTYGKVDYVGSGTSTKDYYKGRAEGYIDYRVNKRFSPFVGLGYRHLFDASGGSTSSTGATGYDRLSQYLYAPIGARVDLTDKLSVKAQYNLFLKGRQTSYFSTASSTASDATNNQNSGWGTDFTANYQIDDTWSTYGFFRYWDIKKSDTSTYTNAGVTYAGYEPQNTTEEIGVGVAYGF